jgi:peptidoglycan-N-acetylglucosamine deacetylase
VNAAVIILHHNDQTVSMLRNYYGVVIACAASVVLLSSHQASRGDEAARENGWDRTPAIPHRQDAGLRARVAPYTIYLTFDDGPSEGSPLVNDLSRSDSVAVNVFLIGNNAFNSATGRRRLQQYADNPLIEMGNHSYTHAQRHYRNYFKKPDLVLADFDRNKDSLHLSNGITRLPGRNFFRIDGFYRNDPENGQEAADELAAAGYRVFGWDLEWRNKKSEGFELHSGREMLQIVTDMLEKKKTFLPGRLVMLLHDQEVTDINFRRAVDDFIRLAQADGRFRFDHLSGY